MSLSNLTFYGGDIIDGSHATPGLWNRRFSTFSQNLDQLSSDASDRFSGWDKGSISTDLVSSGTTITIDSDVSISGIAHQKTQDAGGQVYNVKAFGARGDGSTDDTAAIRAALSAATANNIGGVVLFPAGKYIISSTITIRDAHGLILEGSGISGTALRPVSMTGKDVISLVDSRRCGIRDLRILGDPVNPVSAMIRSDSSNPIAGMAPTQHVFERLQLADDAADGFDYGFRFTATGTDANNDLHIIDKVSIENFRTAAISIEHSNSLNHKIVNTNIGSGPIAFLVTGGNFFAHNIQASATSVEIQVNGQVRKPIFIQNYSSEGNSPLVFSDGTDQPHMFIENLKRAGSTSGTTQIDYRADGHFVLTNSYIEHGQTDVTWRFTHEDSFVRFTNCVLSPTRLEWDGILVSQNNRWLPFAVEEVAGSSDRIIRSGDTGGGFVANRLRQGMSHTPASGTASGSTGDIAWDEDFIYVCASEDSWRRASLSPF